VETDFCKINEIILPKGYNKVYLEHGEVSCLKQYWYVRQMKDLELYMVDIKGIQECKRIILTKKKGNVSYKLENDYFRKDKTKKMANIMKRNAPNISAILVPQVKNQPIPLNEDTAEDVEYLLRKRFGDEWRNCFSLKYYVDVLANKTKMMSFIKKIAAVWNLMYSNMIAFNVN